MCTSFLLNEYYSGGYEMFLYFFYLLLCLEEHWADQSHSAQLTDCGISKQKPDVSFPASTGPFSGQLNILHSNLRFWVK